jgi:hypothetical protein
MDLLQNLAVNLKATGPAAVVAVWFICLTLISIFGTATAAAFSVGVLCTGGLTVLLALLKSDQK